MGEAQGRATTRAGWAPRCRSSCPGCSSRTAQPQARHTRASAWPSFICKLSVICLPMSCLLLMLHFNSVRRKTVQEQLSFILGPGGTSWVEPEARCAHLTQPNLTHPSARPRWASQRFVKL